MFASRFASSIVTSFLLAALTGAALAGAESQPPDSRSHLLVVPDTGQGQAALAQTDARVVARYRSFTLVEANSRDDQRLRRAGADRRDDMRQVRLAGRTIDPASGRESLAGKHATHAKNELVLVQFVGPVKPAWLERLRATGGRVLGYQAQNAYLVHARGAAVERLAALVGTESAIRAVVPVKPGDKLEGTTRGGTVAVETVAGEPGRAARDRAQALGARLQRPSTVAGVTTLFLRLSAEDVANLVSDPGVLLVEPYTRPTPLDERASQIAAGNLASGIPTAPGYLDWLTAHGFPTTPFDFAIDVTDEGLDNGSAGPPAATVDHPDFYENGAKPGTDRVAYATDYTSDGSARDCGGHGTNVASVATGYNDQPGTGNGTNDSAGYNYGLGVAPQAQLGASKIFDCGGGFGLAPATFTSLTAAAYAGGARISNNSWGFPGERSVLGSYNQTALEYDSLVRDAQPLVPGNQEMVEVFAAGNAGSGVSGSANEGYGSITPPGTAKNVITVGASENVRSISGTDGCGVPDSGANLANDVVDFSSRGPTDDGRLKPDLVAPGTHMVGARPTHGFYSGFGACAGQEQFPPGSLYNLISGTSQAAPVVSGAAALVRDWYRRGPGGGTAVPSPAMTKAILANTATDVAGGSDGKGGTLGAAPSDDAGWGRVNLAGVLDGTPRDFVDQTDLLVPGASSVRSYDVANTGQPVRVTLVWTDPVPLTSGGDAFVNDLDLEVSAGGNTYLGNVFAGGVSRPGGAADFRNNVESVVLPAGTNGRFSVKVVGKNIARDGVPGSAADPDQDFALVVSNATARAQPSPVLVHDQTSVDDSPTVGGNHDGYIEPGESFALTERIRNKGDGAATNVQGTLSAPPGGALTVTSGGSAYDPIGAGGPPQANTTPFQATLAGTAPCGADAPVATLQLTSDPGFTDSVPVVIPTGRPGPTTTRSRNANVTIPDNNSAGVSSTLVVASAGRIKDLNVRINSLTHPHVGDLVIDLTGPDGTRVVLADHPGGPDNSGSNFTNTVFDDEAAVNIGDGSAPYTGSFRPQHDSLSRFDGKLQQGTWTLRVRDLFESDVGTLVNWGTSTTNAECDPDTFPPETTIDGSPPNLSNSRTASFAFSSNESDSTFECRMDGGDFAPCANPKSYSGLADGDHAFQVMAFDGFGRPDASPAVRSWRIDATAPTVNVVSPANGSTTTGSRPEISGRAGTAAGDSGTVAVNLYRGPLASGLPTRTLLIPRDGGIGTWSADFGSLSDGSYTVRADQSDAAGNVGTSGPSTFTLTPPKPAPTFVVAPAQERLADALSGNLKVLAGCASACRASARLTVSARAARRLGLTARAAVALGNGAKRLSSAGTAAVRLSLSSRARAALRGRALANATLEVTVSERGQKLAVKRSVALRRSAGLRDIAAHGLRLWAACAKSCPLSGRLTLSAREARRLGLKPKGSAPVEVATGRTTASKSGAALTLKVHRSQRAALRRARSANVLLEAVARAVSNQRRSATLKLTLRR